MISCEVLCRPEFTSAECRLHISTRWTKDRDRFGYKLRPSRPLAHRLVHLFSLPIHRPNIGAFARESSGEFPDPEDSLLRRSVRPEPQ
jgi:hypothetical protein